jgi:hypothetical protein
LFVASLGVIAEWLTLFLPLPIHLAITQVPSEFVILSLAPTIGIWGISFGLVRCRHARQLPFGALAC